MKRKVFLGITLFLIGLACVYASVIWTLKEQESFVRFTARSAFGKVKGTIPGIHGEIRFDGKDLEHSGFKTWVGPKELDTQNNKRDKHLRSEDFLDVLKFPKISFESRKIEREGNKYLVTGNLTIKETTKEVTFPFSLEEHDNTAVFRGSFSINRLDYGIGKPSKFAGNNVDIEIEALVQK